MNYWTRQSIEFAEQRNYLDELFKVYLTAQEGSHLFRWEMNCAKLSEVCYNSFC